MTIGQGKLDPTFAGKAGVANRLITAFGGTANISYLSAEVYNKKTATSSGGVTVTYELPASPPFPYKKHEINGTSVLEGDLKTYIASYQTPEEPPVNSAYTYLSEKFTIVGVSSLTSGNLVASYELQIRRVGGSV